MVICQEEHCNKAAATYEEVVACWPRSLPPRYTPRYCLGHSYCDPVFSPSGRRRDHVIAYHPYVGVWVEHVDDLRPNSQILFEGTLSQCERELERNAEYYKEWRLKALRASWR